MLSNYLIAGTVRSGPDPTRAALESVFEERNAALAPWLGRDLDEWPPRPGRDSV
jgi:hypothetical protein